MKKIIINLMSFSLLFTGCSTLKTAKLIKSGSVNQVNFVSKTKFVFDTHIKVPVKINEKTYTFIFDTGAGVSAISEKLAKELGLKAKSSSTTEDSQGRDTNLNFYQIGKIEIGDVGFINQPFVGADLSKMDCFGKEFDGIIGSNLMRKAKWFIDMENKEMTISDEKNKLPKLPKPEIIHFKTFNSGPLLNVCPFFNLYIPGIVENKMMEFDMGSSGGFRLNKKMLSENSAIKKQWSIGNSSQGLFGRNTTDTTFYFSANNIVVDAWTIKDSLNMRYVSKGTPILGMQFLKSFNMILDWSSKEITLSKTKDLDRPPISNYGFKIGLVDSEIKVTEIFKEFEADIKGLKLGDKILKINNIDFENATTENFCSQLKNFENLSSPELNLKIIQENKKIEYQIKKNK